MSTTRLQEVLICFGKKKQADIATAQAAADMWRFTKLNAALVNPKLATENDAEEYGKGHEFPTATYKTAWDVGVTLEKYLGAEIGAWAVCFGLGKVVKSGAGPYVYTCTPLIPSAGDAAELPYLSYVEQIRPGAGVVLDRQAVGMAVESFQITVGSGPGRANSKISIELVGSGKVIDSATGITMPAATAEKLLPSASLTLSINGVDYVTNKNIVSLETGWKNNIRMDAGFFPGSGFQTAGDGSTGAIRGRLEFGNRAGNLKFVARFMNGSDEYTKLKAQTTGTAVVTLAYDANNSLQLTWQQITYSVVEIAETDQILTVAVDCLPMYHATNGILTAVARATWTGSASRTARQSVQTGGLRNPPQRSHAEACATPGSAASLLST